jgi:predicted RNA binding protein YcfA (HicA-like mRNA interferase family)
MTPFPSLIPRELVSALERAGWIEKRQRGSHLILWNEESGQVITVPMHTRDLPTGTLRAIVNQAGLCEETLRKFL